MGVTWEQIREGVVDIGAVVNRSMENWAILAGKSVATPPITAAQSASPAAPTTSNLAQNPSGLAAVPSWLWLVGGALLLWRFAK